jgi:hypothetical protein
MFYNIRCQVVDRTSIVFLESILLTIDCLLGLRQFLGDFGFFLTVTVTGAKQSFTGSFHAALVSARFELRKISNLYQVLIFLRATRGVVTEMHGHARIRIRYQLSYSLVGKTTFDIDHL